MATAIPQTIWIESSHGSIRIHHPGSRVTNITVNGEPGRWLGDANSTLIGFLEPAMEYRIATFLDSPDGQRSEAWTVSTRESPWKPSDHPVVQPGSRVYEPSCTLAFVLRDFTNETLYILSAGHCNFQPGVVYSVNDGSILGGGGEVLLPALQGVTDNNLLGLPEDDWALLKILPEVRNQTSPSVLHWGGPTGIMTTDRLSSDMTACLYGWGQAFQSNPELRPRCGTVEASNDDRTYWWGPSDVGDSGSPVIDSVSGLAIGIQEGGAPPLFGYGRAFNVCAALGALAEAGLQLQLLTAPRSDKLPGPTIPHAIPDPYTTIGTEKNRC